LEVYKKIKKIYIYNKQFIVKTIKYKAVLSEDISELWLLVITVMMAVHPFSDNFCEKRHTYTFVTCTMNVSDGRIGGASSHRWHMAGLKRQRHNRIF